jgi:hypothetical protein
LKLQKEKRRKKKDTRFNGIMTRCHGFQLGGFTSHKPSKNLFVFALGRKYLKGNICGVVYELGSLKREIRL